MNTTKKTYCQPSLEVVMLDASDLICTSGSSGTSAFLPVLISDIEEEGYAD